MVYLHTAVSGAAHAAFGLASVHGLRAFQAFPYISFS